MALLEPELATKVMRRALVHGGDLAEVFAEESVESALRVEGSKLTEPVVGRELGTAVRVVSGGAMYLGYADSFAERDLLRAAAAVAQAVRALSSGRSAAVRPARPASGGSVRDDQDPVDMHRMAELLRECDDRARGFSGEVVQVSSRCSESRRVVEVFNSDGRVAYDDRRRVKLDVEVVARRDGHLETGWETLAGRGDLAQLGQVGSMVDRAARRSVTSLRAKAAPSGTMPVVVANGLGGVLLHEILGHGLEADVVQKRASVFAGRLGDKLAAPFVTAYDDGSRPSEWGSDRIDDEGTPTGRTAILADGVLVSYLYDLVRARKEGVQSTGNGRRQSFRHAPAPRMTNTYFAPGDATPEELISGVRRGLYAAALDGGEVEPATGDFVFGVSEAYVIEHGKIASPVRGATLIGNAIDALAAIDGVADDTRLAAASCGKLRQVVPVSVGQPHIRLRALTVGGTA